MNTKIHHSKKGFSGFEKESRVILFSNAPNTPEYGKYVKIADKESPSETSKTSEKNEVIPWIAERLMVLRGKLDKGNSTVKDIDTIKDVQTVLNSNESLNEPLNDHARVYLQQVLLFKRKDEHGNPYYKGKIDGIPGRNTRDAFTRFRTDNNLSFKKIQYPEDMDIVFKVLLAPDEDKNKRKDIWDNYSSKNKTSIPSSLEQNKNQRDTVSKKKTDKKNRVENNENTNSKEINENDNKKNILKKMTPQSIIQDLNKINDWTVHKGLISETIGKVGFNTQGLKISSPQVKVIDDNKIVINLSNNNTININRKDTEISMTVEGFKSEMSALTQPEFDRVTIIKSVKVEIIPAGNKKIKETTGSSESKNENNKELPKLKKISIGEKTITLKLTETEQGMLEHAINNNFITDIASDQKTGKITMLRGYYKDIINLSEKTNIFDNIKTSLKGTGITPENIYSIRWKEKEGIVFIRFNNLNGVNINKLTSIRNLDLVRVKKLPDNIDFNTLTNLRKIAFREHLEPPLSLDKINLNTKIYLKESQIWELIKVSELKVNGEIITDSNKHLYEYTGEIVQEKKNSDKKDSVKNNENTKSKEIKENENEKKIIREMTPQSIMQDLNKINDWNIHKGLIAKTIGKADFDTQGLGIRSSQVKVIDENKIVINLSNNNIININRKDTGISITVEGFTPEMSALTNKSFNSVINEKNQVEAVQEETTSDKQDNEDKSLLQRIKDWF